MTAYQLPTDETELDELVSDPSTPTETLLAFAVAYVNREVEDNDYLVENLTSNPSVTAEILSVIAEDEDPWTRGYAARNPLSPVQVLENCFYDEDPSVRADVACNPSAPLAMLASLAEDGEVEVRSAVAFNPSTPVDVLVVLAGDEEEEVRDMVNEKLTIPVLVEYLKPNFPEVTVEMPREWLLGLLKTQTV